ncbi:hypothetical protein [Roseovarius sp.]|uniref:hypothetical protein n=1 Tax=Roseovarius sp. TaxID=1486281 RepID=UPI003D11F0CD
MNTLQCSQPAVSHCICSEENAKFLSECIASWIAARLRAQLVDPHEIAQALETKLGACISDHREAGWPIVSVHLCGISGQARCLHGALTDWIDQWEKISGVRVRR